MHRYIARYGRAVPSQLLHEAAAAAAAALRITLGDFVRSFADPPRTGRVVEDDDEVDFYKVLWDDDATTSDWLDSCDIQKTPAAAAAAAASEEEGDELESRSYKPLDGAAAPQVSVFVFWS
jgi:hypothetical protein